MGSLGVEASTVNWIVMLLSVVSFPSNALVLYLTWQKRRDWSTDLRLIFFISCIDITTSLLNIIFAVIELTTNHEIFQNGTIFCQLVGFIIISVLISSSTLVITLSFERYLALCYKKKLPGALLWSIAMFQITLVLILGIISAFQGNFIVSSGLTYCIPNFQGNIWSKIHYAILAIISTVGLQCLSFFFMQIILFRRKTVQPLVEYRDRMRRKKKRGFEPSTEDSNLESQSIPDPDKIAKNIGIRSMIFIFIYNFIYLPNFVAIIWDVSSGAQRPHLLDNITAVALHLGGICNPFLVLFLHSQISKEFLEITSKAFSFQSKSIQSVTVKDNSVELHELSQTTIPYQARTSIHSQTEILVN